MSHSIPDAKVEEYSTYGYTGVNIMLSSNATYRSLQGKFVATLIITPYSVRT